MNFFGGREDKAKRRQENGQTWFFFVFVFQNCPLWAYTKKQHICFFCCMVIPLGLHSVSKGFVNCFWFLNKKSYYGSWTIKPNHGESHLPWSVSMVHGVNQPLNGKACSGVLKSCCNWTLELPRKPFKEGPNNELWWFFWGFFLIKSLLEHLVFQSWVKLLGSSL